MLLQNSHYNSWRESYEKPRQCIKKQRHHFVNRDPYSQSYGFPSSHVRIGELDHKEGLVPKHWCFWIVVLDKTLQSSLDSKENMSVNPKGNQPWIFVRRTDAKFEAPILWAPDENSWLIAKDPDARKNWGQKKKRSAKDEMVSITDSIDMNLSKLQEIVKDTVAWHATVHGVTKSQTGLSSWKTTATYVHGCFRIRFRALPWNNIFNCLENEPPPL